MEKGTFKNNLVELLPLGYNIVCGTGGRVGRGVGCLRGTGRGVVL